MNVQIIPAEKRQGQSELSLRTGNYIIIYLTVWQQSCMNDADKSTKMSFN